MDEGACVTDDSAMNTETNSGESIETRTSPSRPPLVRPASGRAIGGVAAGLASYLGLSVGLVRFLFLVAVLFGGAGIVLYAAGWLLIPDENESDSIAQRLLDNLGSGPSWIGVVLVVVAALIVLDNVTILSGSLLWAAVLVIAGLLLYRGDIPGPRRPSREATASSSAAPGSDGGAGDTGGTAPPPPPPVAVRPTPPPAPPTPPPPPSILGRLTMGVALLALGVLAVIDNLTPLLDPRPRHYLALATVVLGLGLLAGAFVGRARWMILLGIFLVPPLIASPAAEVDWRAGFEQVYAPTDMSTLLPSYEGAAGRYVFDLTQIEWEGQVEILTVEMGAGEIVVLLPETVGLTGRAELGIGQLESPEGTQGGIGDIGRTFNTSGSAGSLDVDLEVGVGSIRITQLPDTGGEIETRIQPLDHADLVTIDRQSGDVEVDLSRLELSSDDQMEIYLGTGNVTVLVPDDLNVGVDAFTETGSISLFGSVEGGTGAFASDQRLADEELPTLGLYIEVGTGSITVTERNR